MDEKEQTLDMFPQLASNSGGIERRKSHARLSRVRSSLSRALQEIEWLENLERSAKMRGRHDDAFSLKKKIRIQQEKARAARVEIEGIELELHGDWAPKEMPTAEQSARVRHASEAASAAKPFKK